MLKLMLRVLILTAILQVASLAFADEMIITLLILVTIALSAASLVTNREAPQEALVIDQEPVILNQREPVTVRSRVETPV